MTDKPLTLLKGVAEYEKTRAERQDTRADNWKGRPFPFPATSTAGNPCSHLMATVGARVLAECLGLDRPGAPARLPLPGQARLVFEAMERQRIVDDANMRQRAALRREQANGPWPTTPSAAGS